MGQRIKLPRYVHAFTDRHGKPRYYLRRPGLKRVSLPGLPWSPAFMAAYEAGMAGDVPPVEIGASRTKPGTVNAAIAGYFTSTAFLSMKQSTRSGYRWILQRFRAEHGEKRIALLERRHIDKIIAAKASTPTAANNLLKVLRALLDFAAAEGMRAENPAAGAKRVKVRSEGYRPWSEAQIAAYRERHALGTRARLAFELLLSTGQRRSDVIRMGRQHVRDGLLSIRQQKTGTLIEIPVLPELRAAIEAMPASDHLTFLTTDHGQAFTGTGFSNWFRDMCDAASIAKGYSAHGLRKAAATVHADSGATAHELMAWFGWKTLTEAERYTRSADRKRLAKGMVRKLASGTSIGKPE